MFRSLRFVLCGAALLGVFGFGAPIPVAHAANSYGDITSQGIIFAVICTSKDAACPCRDTGDCTLDHALQVFVNLSTFILGISGSAVLFVFIYGGFKWIIARGDHKNIHSGTQAITAGVIGLLIIFGAYVAINFIVSGLTTPTGEAPKSDELEKTVNQGLTGGKGVEVFETE